MKTIAFFNNKGGVGKTTLICNLGAMLAKKQKRVLIIDADPQCNASEYMLNRLELIHLYKDTTRLTLYNFIKPLESGKGFSNKYYTKRCENFDLDLIAGDPRLAIVEDLLASDWGYAISGQERGIRTTLVFKHLVNKIRTSKKYDFLLIDVGPSLSSINRSVLLSSDYFVSPMSSDIFSLRAVENIAEWFQKWWKSWVIGSENSESDILKKLKPKKVKFAGYVTLQYYAKRQGDQGLRPVKAYDNIIERMASMFSNNFDGVFGCPTDQNSHLLGTVPNLFSLVPMSQQSGIPIFRLTSSNGVKGAHFAKVREAEEIFSQIADEIIHRTTTAHD